MGGDAIASWSSAKSDRFLRATRNAFESEDWESVASRAYYAAYHLVAALLEEKASVTRRPWRAEVLQGDFRQNFTHKSYLFSMRDADLLRRLIDVRYDADYHNIPITRRKAERALAEAEDLCSRLKEVIDDV